jgi:ribosome-associated heat shock protein Hsp15
MSVRLDKWLQVARVFKTRSQATRACTLGRVRVNGVIAKPHRKTALEDKIEIRFGDWTRVLVIKGIREKPVPKKMAAELFLDMSPPRPNTDHLDWILKAAAPEQREPGSGRPTKRERRLIGKLKRR